MLCDELFFSFLGLLLSLFVILQLLCMFVMAGILVLLFLLSLGAGFVQRVSGFGFGIFIMMFLPYIMPSYNEAVALSGILSGSIAFTVAMCNFKHICWRRMLLVVPANAAVSFFVVRCMANISTSVMLKCFGVALVVMAFYFLFFEGRVRGYFGGSAAQLAVGAVSGVMGAMFGTPGPPVVLYGMCVFKEKLEYLATMQAFWTVFNIVYLFYRSGNGYYSGQTHVYWVCGLCGAFVGTFLGAKCFDSLDTKRFRLVVYMAMAASGVVAFLK